MGKRNGVPEAAAAAVGRGGPGAARGEKLEKGRFKYQAPRGGPRSLAPSASPLHAVSHSFHHHPLSSLSASLRFFSSSGLLSFHPPPSPPPHYHPPPFAVLRLCTYTPVSRTYIHRHVHTSIDPRPEKRRLRAVRRRRTLLRQRYVLIGRSPCRRFCPFWTRHQLCRYNDTPTSSQYATLSLSLFLVFLVSASS